MTRTRRVPVDGVSVDVPLPDGNGPLEFVIHFTEAEIRALSIGCVPMQIQDTCVGLLEWLKDEPGPAKQQIRPGSRMGQRAKRSTTGDPGGTSGSTKRGRVLIRPPRKNVEPT